MCGFRYLSSVVVDVDGASIYTLVAVLPVVADVQYQPIGGQFLTEKLVG